MVNALRRPAPPTDQASALRLARRTLLGALATGDAGDARTALRSALVAQSVHLSNTNGDLAWECDELADGTLDLYAWEKSLARRLATECNVATDGLEPPVYFLVTPFDACRIAHELLSWTEVWADQVAWIVERVLDTKAVA